MKKKLHPFEIVWYSITGAVGLWGLVYIVLGVICRFLKSDNALFKANAYIGKTFGLGGYFWWGIIILAIALVCFLLVALIFATKADGVVDKASKRAARLARLQEIDAKEAEAAPVVDAEVSEAKPE